MRPKLILASASPQRRAILEQIGVPFEVRLADVDELDAGPPAEVVLENAYRKAAAVSAAAGADGTGGLPVAGRRHCRRLGSRIFGKPRDPAQAAEMLRRSVAAATSCSAACA